MQYDRAFKLTLGGQTIAELAGDPDNSLRVRFRSNLQTAQTPNDIHAIVTNLSEDTAASYMKMIESRALVTLEAGYNGNTGLIFKGDCWRGINGRENPTDTTLQIFARDGGRAYDSGVVNKALEKGSTPKDHFDIFAQALEQFGITPGYVPEMSSPKYPRGVSFFGAVKDHLRTLGASTGNMWSIQQGQLQMVPTDGYVPGAPFILNSSTGLIGQPTQTPEGVMARCLINPAINCGSGNLVQIDQKSVQGAVLSSAYAAEANNLKIPPIAADGIYKVFYIEISGDSRGQDWYQDLTLIAAHGDTGVSTAVNKMTNLH